MMEDSFSILSLHLINWWKKTGLLQGETDFQTFQDPDIPRGWRARRASLLQSTARVLVLFSRSLYHHLACSCSASTSALGQV